MIHFFEKSAPGIRDGFAVKRLLLPRAGVELPALQLGGSQLPVTLAPDQMPRAPQYTCTDKHKLKILRPPIPRFMTSVSKK